QCPRRPVRRRAGEHPHRLGGRDVVEMFYQVDDVAAARAAAAIPNPLAGVDGEAIAAAASRTWTSESFCRALQPMAAARKLRFNGDGFGEGEDHKLVKPWWPRGNERSFAQDARARMPSVL